MVLECIDNERDEIDGRIVDFLFVHQIEEIGRNEVSDRTINGNKKNIMIAQIQKQINLNNS